MRTDLLDSLLRQKVHRPRRTLLLGLALGAIVGLGPFTASQARHSDDNQACTTETIAGDYGFRTTGVQVRPDGSKVDFASIGHYLRDGQGNVVSGTVTSNAGGTIARVTLTGTYTVNPDCTGSQTSNLSTGGVVHLDFVIVDSGQRVEFILVDPTNTFGGTQTRL